MRLLSHRSQALLFLVAALAATVACQSAQRQTFLPPAQAQAPPIKATAKPPETPPAKVVAAPTPEPELKPSVTPAPKADAVAALIAHVEKEYQTGLDSYHAGNLEAAKKNFDTAVNLLLNADATLRADERMDRELDRVMEGVNGLDLLASAEGEGAQQDEGPSPGR